jgi:VanZ family protein
MKKYLLPSAGAAAWMILIYYLSSVRGSHLGPDSVILDLIKNMAHFVLFGALAALYLSMLTAGRRKRESLTPYLLSFVLTVLYAIGDEFHQSFVPGRYATVTDVMIDVSGAFTILCIFVLREKKGQKRLTERVTGNK